MSSSTTPAAQGYIAQGNTGVRGIETTKRKYSLSDQIVWNNRNWAMFDNILRQELQVVTVDDMEPKLFVKDETPVKFTCHSNGADTTYEGDTMYISDTQAKWLQANDVLSCNQIFCDSDGAAYTTTKFASGYVPETIVVESVSLSTPTSGIAKVIVKRGNGYQQSAAAAGVVSTVSTDHVWLKQGNSLQDGWTAPTAIWQEPSELYNYLQNFSRTWQESENEKNTNMFAKETMADKAKRNRIDFFREREHALLFGRRARNVVNSQSAWRTGGLVEFIPYTGALDSVSRFINFAGSFDYDTFREKAEIIFRYGSQNKVAFCGGKFFTALLNNFDKYITTNPKLEAKWGGKVLDLETGHGSLHLLRHPVLSELDATDQAWAYDCIVADLAYVKLMIMQGMDVRVKTNVQDNDVHYEKAELYGTCGLYRSNPSAHAYVYGITG
jgi:hypothetical protein